MVSSCCSCLCSRRFSPEQIAPYNPYKTNYSNVKQPPSVEHFIGTDELGRDGFSRLIYGARISLLVGVSVSAISTTVGVALGAIAGFFGGAVDMIIMRAVDLFMAFPFLVLAIALVAVFGPSLFNMMLALILLYWIWFARLVRGMVLTLRETEFVVGAKAAGASDLSIIFRHILPNVFPVVVVQGSFSVADAILIAAGLSYLGLGAQPPTAEWGSMLSNAKELMRDPACAVNRAGSRHHDHRTRHQLHRRCAARRPRSNSAPIVCNNSPQYANIWSARLYTSLPFMVKQETD